MRVEVEISGVLRKPGGKSQHRIELPAGARCVDLFAALGYGDVEQRALRVSRQGEILTPAQTLADGDVLIVFATVGGG